MNEKPDSTRDYSETLFLPQTDFPMRAGLPQKEPELLARWRSLDLYGRLRAAAKGRPRFILHDGPPYANGNIHIGTALNKILKDVVTRSQQMLGFDANYVPGWDCHGLPIEWKIEEENYRAKGKSKPDLSNPAAMVEFRQECRALPSTGSRCSGTNSSGSAWSATGTILQHHDFRRRGADRARAHEIRRERHALSRLEAGDVVGGGKDRARRSRGRV